MNGVSKILLNGKPTFVDATLDQGFWPDGAYTAPTDAALKWDITETKAMGFNAIRKHIKVEPARWYYDADTTGMLVLQDMPSMNSGYTATPADDTAFRSQLHQMVQDLRAETSIISWEPYNEGWGLDRNTVSNAVERGQAGRRAGPHRRPEPARRRRVGLQLLRQREHRHRRRQRHRLAHLHRPGRLRSPTTPTTASPSTASTAAGGSPSRPTTGISGFINYAGATDSAQLTQKFVQTADALREEAQCQLSGGVYTQLTDVEGEVNGLWTYDRRVPKMDVRAGRGRQRQGDRGGSTAGDCGQNVVSKAGSWPLTDGSGSVAKDTSGNGNDATLSNGGGLGHLRAERRRAPD